MMQIVTTMVFTEKSARLALYQALILQTKSQKKKKISDTVYDQPSYHEL